MSRLLDAGARRAERRALLSAAAVSVATSVHHVYGAVIYHTPWRYHAVAVSAGTLVIMFAALRLSRVAAGTMAGRVAWWTFWGMNAAVFALLIGAFEGVYNHALKDLLFYGGTQLSVMRALFPPPMYELPNDWFFELTGVLQIVPSAVTAVALGSLLRHRPRRALAASPVGESAMISRLVKVAQWSIRLTGPAQVALGVAFWVGRAVSLRPVHMLIGMVFDLALLTLVVLAARGGLRPVAVVGGIALALAIPLFGAVHARILPGPAHWVVRSAHLLLGVIAMVVAGRLERFARAETMVVVRQASPSPTAIQHPETGGRAVG
jgi:hypothetical protein